MATGTSQQALRRRGDAAPRHAALRPRLVAAQPVRVLVAAADEQTRGRLRVAVERRGLAVCAEARDATGVVRAALDQLPEVCVLHMSMPGSVVRAVGSIAAELPSSAVVVVVKSGSERGLMAALAAGASAYVVEASGPKRLADAIEAAASGYLTLPRPMLRSLVERLARYEDDASRLRLPDLRSARLTPREREVHDAALAGWTTAEIAQSLYLSPVTVRRHVSSARRKLELPSREALRAVPGTTQPHELGLLDEDGAAGHEEERAPDPARANLAPLTKRQLDVLRLVASGLPNREIAAELVIAPSTVKNHMTKVMSKLGARNRADAAMLGYRRGYL